MPPLPSNIDLDALIRKLKRVKAPASQVITKNGRLWGYSRCLPSQMEYGRVFSYIESCVTRLRRKFPGIPTTCSFQNDQDFRHCDGETFPAAYFYTPPNEVFPTLGWTRIAVSGAYEMHASSSPFDKARGPPYCYSRTELIRRSEHNKNCALHVKVYVRRSETTLHVRLYD